MRLIGILQSDTQAERFGDFLHGKEIGNQVDQNTNGSWEIWVLDDDHMDTAKSLLAQFNESPDDPIFTMGSQVGKNKKKQARKNPRSSRNRIVDGSTIFYRPPVPYGILSASLIMISVFVAILTPLDKDGPVKQKLLITEYTAEKGYIHYAPSLPEIRRGQIWRLFSPMFLHFGIIHILFNVLWMRDLGSLVEARKGTWLLLVFVLVAAAASNLAQFLVSGPNFGGMSGVVYALLGYVWMQGKFNPASQLRLQKQTVTLMIVWFFLCLTGFIGPVANTAHAVGAGTGIAWGYLAARLARRA